MLEKSLFIQPLDKLEKLFEEPKLLKTPIVRNGSRVTVGADEETWKKWLETGA